MDLFAAFCAFGSAVAWAIASIWYSELSKDHSVYAVNFARAAVALPLFVVAVFLTSGGLTSGWVSYGQIQSSHFGWISLSVLTSFGFGDAAFFWSTRYLGVPTAMAIAFCYPLWTVLMDLLFL